MHSAVKAWIEAMRLRTLPVSLAGVVTGAGYARLHHSFEWLPVVLCLIFATLAQISSNFANEYYDFRDGLDRKGREGPRRGVTEGDITPRAMLLATFLTLGLACVCGLSLLCFGPWWLILVGIGVALGVMAYSTGPYPLSRHCLGEVAVIIFFGLVPVNFTYFLQTGCFTTDVLAGSLAIGLMGANVLIVNNYRDIPDDRAVGKHTLATLLCPRGAVLLYFLNGLFAAALTLSAWMSIGTAWLAAPLLYVVAHTLLTLRIRSLCGRALTPMLGATSVLMALYSIVFALAA